MKISLLLSLLKKISVEMLQEGSQNTNQQITDDMA